MKNFTSHSSAIIDEGAIIGDGSRIWHFSHICDGARVGKNVSIGQNVFVSGLASSGCTWRHISCSVAAT